MQIDVYFTLLYFTCIIYYSQKGCIQSHVSDVTSKFWEIRVSISETVQDRDIFAMED